MVYVPNERKHSWLFMNYQNLITLMTHWSHTSPLRSWSCTTPSTTLPTKLAQTLLLRLWKQSATVTQTQIRFAHCPRTWRSTWVATPTTPYSGRTFLQTVAASQPVTWQKLSTATSVPSTSSRLTSLLQHLACRAPAGRFLVTITSQAA